MTVPAAGFSGPTFVQTPANGVATVYGFPFLITVSTDLIVCFVINGVYIQQLSGFTVAGFNNPNGGQITFAVAPPLTTYVDIRSVIPETQPTNFANLGAYYPEATTSAVDRCVRQITDLYRLCYQFGIHGPDTESTLWPALPSAAARANTGLVFDVNGLPSVGVIPSGTFTQATWDFFLSASAQLAQPVGLAISGPSAAEIATGVVVVAPWIPSSSLLRYGLVPNSPAAAGSNTTILQTLFNPLITNGPTGTFRFPNDGTASPDTYYFNQSIQIRDGVTWDLSECLLSFSATYDVTWNTKAFIRFIRDVTIQNGSISVNFNGSTGINAGMVMLVGSRNGYAFGAYPNGIFDQDNLIATGQAPMGNCTLRNLRITSNNPSAPTGPSEMVLMFGGLRNIVCENLVFNGQGVVNYGIYYEFGWASTNGNPGNQTLWTTSHMTAFRFTNITANNMGPTISIGGGAVGLGGAYHGLVENLLVDTAVCAFTYTPGEALFYRPWSPSDIEGAKRGIVLRNIVGSNILGTGIVLGGSSAVSGSYLNAAIPPLTLNQQVDLMAFSLDGFSINAAGVGLNVSGDCIIQNGKADGVAGSGQIVVSDDCTNFFFNNVDALNGSSSGYRLSFPGVMSRLKKGRIINSQIAGNTGNGVIAAQTRSVSIEDCRLGYNSAYDAVNETTQINCILAAGPSNGNGVVALRCFTTPGSGGLAYAQTGSPTGCNIVDPQGTISLSGTWNLNSVVQASSTVFGQASSVVNTTPDKYAGKLGNDTSNKRIMIAQGPNPTDQWIPMTPTTAITPS